MKTISSQIRTMYQNSAINRLKQIRDISNPAIIKQMEELIASYEPGGKFKLPGEIRGHHKKFLQQEFTEGWFGFDNLHSLVMYFKLISSQGVISYLKVYHNHTWHKIEMTVVPQYNTAYKPMVENTVETPISKNETIKNKLKDVLNAMANFSGNMIKNIDEKNVQILDELKLTIAQYNNEVAKELITIYNML